MTRKKPTSREITNGITRYLNEIERGTVERGYVHLGAIGNGLPHTTSNPTDVERAIKIIKEQAREGGTQQRLLRHQRVITLTRALEVMRANGEGETARAFFVEHAFDWATERGVGYSAFRMMGVPVDALTEAGITRGFEP